MTTETERGDETRCADGRGQQPSKARRLKQRVRHELRCLWGRTGYRPWAKVLHRLNLHHTRSNVMPDGAILTHCEWCGLRGKRTSSLVAEYTLRARQLAKAEDVRQSDARTRAINELRNLTTCRCEPAWTDRGLHETHCVADYRSDLDTLIAPVSAGPDVFRVSQDKAQQ